MPAQVPDAEGVSSLPSWADALPRGHPHCSPLCWPCSASGFPGGQEQGGDTAKNHLRGCGERAAAPLAEEAGQGTAPHFPRHHGARPPPRGLQGSTQNPTLGTKAVGQVRRCSQLHLPGETPPAAKPLQTLSPAPSPSPTPMAPASRATCDAVGAPRARARRGDARGVRGKPPSCPQAAAPSALRVPGPLTPPSHPGDAGTGACWAGMMLSLVEEDAQPCAMASAWPRSRDAPRGGPKAGVGQTWHVPWASGGDFSPLRQQVRSF